MTSGGEVVTQFQYAAGHQQITATPREMSGPGWQAAIHGQEAVCIMAYYYMQHIAVHLIAAEPKGEASNHGARVAVRL